MNVRFMTRRRAAALILVWGVLVSSLILAGCEGRDADHDHATDDASSASTAPVAGGLAAADVDGDGIVYQSGMHPWIVQDEPGRCPICGMDLVPTRVSALEAGVVRIDPVTLQNSGVRTARVAVEPISRSVRTTGRFQPNEQRMTVVSPRISGWIERLHVNYEGARVRAGQALLDIYSPELVSTQEEYLLAVRTAERLGDSPDSRRLVEAAERRLSYWDISPDQIARVRATGIPQRTITLHAPAGGTVVRTSAIDGLRVNAGESLMQLSDLSELWLMVDVYEQDLAWIGVGTRARVELPYDPSRSVTGRIDFIHDELEVETRTVKARIRVPNPGLALKPGMYATVHLLGTETTPGPVVPSEAVIRDGERRVVILSLGEGRFMPAEVEIGLESDGRTQVLGGLRGDEIVVTSAQFLIDSESRLSSVIGAMSGHDHGAGPSPGAQSPPSAPGTVDPHSDHSAAVPQIRHNEPREVHIRIDERGFSPARIELASDVETRLRFERRTNATCATDVKIPELGVSKTVLPLGEEIVIAVRPDRAGNYRFVCGMDMIEGSILVSES